MKIKAKKGPRITRTVMCNSRRFVMTNYTGCGYITAGKVYRMRYSHGQGGYVIVSDRGSVIYSSSFNNGGVSNRCAHLDGNQWQLAGVKV